jgi:crotonobetainyl-CoA:carnitine CoA-transferase CaiB-like acyl-CoA transferase
VSTTSAGPAPSVRLAGHDAPDVHRARLLDGEGLDRDVADLSDPTQLAAVRELAAEADVVVENFRSGVMDRLGLGHETLAAANPGLVYCSITGFGAAEGANLPGYDLLVQALGGLMSITGPPDGQPQKVGVALVDVVAGLFATVGILAALRHREQTGAGQRVEVDLLSVLLAALSNQASAFTAAGVVAGRLGNAHPSITPYELYAAKGGDLVVAVGTERQFAALCRVLGIPDVADDAGFATNELRVANRDRLRVVLEERLSDATPAEWMGRLLAVGVPAGEVNDLAGALAGAHRRGAARGRVARAGRPQPDPAVRGAAALRERAPGAGRVDPVGSRLARPSCPRRGAAPSARGWRAGSRAPGCSARRARRQGDRRRAGGPRRGSAGARRRRPRARRAGCRTAP